MSHDPVDDSVVMVPVPRRYLADVYRVLADKMREETVSTRGAGDVPSPQGDDEEHRNTCWTADDLKRLYQLLLARDLRAPLAMLDLAAARQGDKVQFAEVHQRSGLGWGLARQQLAQLTWLVKGEFNRSNWPVRVHTGTGKVLYSFEDPDVARDWLAVSPSTATRDGID